MSPQVHAIPPLWELFRDRLLTTYLATSTKGRAGVEGEILEMGIKSFLMPGFAIRPCKRSKKSYLLVFSRSFSRNASQLANWGTPCPA